MANTGQTNGAYSSISHEIQAAVGHKYKVVEYRFETSSIEKRFSQIVRKPSGDVVLWDLVHRMKKLGLHVPHDLQPRSRYAPHMLVEPLTKYLSGGSMGEYSEDAMSEAYDRVKRAFFVGKLRPDPLERVTYVSSSNSGAPLFMKKGDVISHEMDYARRIMRGMAPPPLTVFHRGKNVDVVRPVFGYPMSMSLIEARFFQPYQAELMKHHSPYVGGKRDVEIGALLNEQLWQNSYVLELDYSGFDGSISAKLISLAFSIIAWNFAFTEDEAKTWELVKRYFCTAPMLLPDGNLIVGRRHGVPSGSMFTQIVDSIVNALAIEYTKIRLGLKVRRYYVLGDDSVIGVVGRRPSLDAVGNAMAELGLKVNVAKSSVTKCVPGAHISFLGHYRESFILRRDREESLRKMLAPERIDVRLFDADEAVRQQALVERIRAFQDDNELIFTELQWLINDIVKGKPIVGPTHTDFAFIRTKAIEGVERWRAGKRSLHIELSRSRAYLRAVPQAT